MRQRYCRPLIDKFVEKHLQRGANGQGYQHLRWSQPEWHKVKEIVCGLLSTFEMKPLPSEVVQFCFTLPLAGGSDAVAAGEGFVRNPLRLPSPLVPRDPLGGRFKCINLGSNTTYKLHDFSWEWLP